MELIPGFNTSDDVESDAKVTIQVGEGQEWRFEVPFKLVMTVKITEGVGEIFGTELPTNSELNFTGVKYSLYAPLPHGCKLEYSLKLNKEQSNITNEATGISEYISEDSNMNQLTNLHFYLENKRQQITDYNLINRGSSKVGPKVLVLGSQFTGKSSVCKVLASYAFKMDRCPLLVNLNPRDGVFSLPGSLTATPISDNFDLEYINGYGGTTTSGTTSHNPKQPLVKNFGFENFTQNTDLYNYQVSKLGVAAISRLEDDPEVKNSGMIIDTPPLALKDIKLIENIVSDFEVDNIVVIGNEKLVIELKKKFSHKINNQQLEVIKLSKNEGVVELEDGYLRKCQEETIKLYFNGNFKNPLSPFKTEINVSDFVFYKVVDLSELNSSLLFQPAGDSFAPGGEEETETKDTDIEKFFTKVNDFSSNNLENLILAVTQLPSTSNSTKELLNTCVMGYVHVSKYEELKGKLKVLLPVPGAFPKTVLIATRIGYTE